VGDANITLADIRRLRCPPSEVIALLAGLLAKVGDATTFVGGTIGFRVHGNRGGTWVVDLSKSGGEWKAEPTDGDFESADTKIYSFAPEFSALVLAPDAIEGCLHTGLIVVEGDKAKLGRLSKLIRRGKGGSSISIRAGM